MDFVIHQARVLTQEFGNLGNYFRTLLFRVKNFKGLDPHLYVGASFIVWALKYESEKNSNFVLHRLTNGQENYHGHPFSCLQVPRNEPHIPINSISNGFAKFWHETLR